MKGSCKYVYKELLTANKTWFNKGIKDFKNNLTFYKNVIKGLGIGWIL
jgi:hypothetical protein